jgi:hypothetical protein
MPAENDRARPPNGKPDEPRTLRPWVPPRIEELPPLTDLTLATGDPIDGGGDIGGGGSTVF